MVMCSSDCCGLYLCLESLLEVQGMAGHREEVGVRLDTGMVLRGTEKAVRSSRQKGLLLACWLMGLQAIIYLRAFWRRILVLPMFS